MSLPILIDMNLSVEWVAFLVARGWPAVHWSNVGAIDADDRELMAWAKTHEHAVFTHDLDFGMLLALTSADGPSVIQIRSQTVLPEQIGDLVFGALQQYESELTVGALLVIEKSKNRVRILPLK